MLRLMFILIIVVQAWAENPKPYASLGDQIYDDMESFSYLVDTGVLEDYRARVQKYLKKCEIIKVQGFALENKKSDPEAGRAYLKRLRALNQEYEFYLNTARQMFDRSMQEKDYDTFSKLIKSGLIDIEPDIDHIIGFYRIYNKGESLEEIEHYIAYRKKARALHAKEAAKRKELYSSYRTERIAQVKKRQAEEKERFRKAVNAETERKKQELHRKQKKEMLSIY